MCRQLTPEVTTTDWKRSKIGLTAIVASRQLKFMIGFEMEGVRSSNGSMIRLKPAG